MNEVLKTIKQRRSVRAFKPEQIKQEELDQIIEAGIFAPSGHNAQPWHFTVIQNREVINRINKISKEIMATMENEWIKNAGLDPNLDITYQAPTLIIVSGRKEVVSWRADCAAAIQNTLLAAESLNIGSVWLGFAAFCFRVAGEAEKIGVPDGYEPYFGIALGYKLDKAEFTTPQRNYNVVNYIR